MSPNDDDKESFASLFSAGPSAALDRRRFRVGEKLDVTVLKIGKVAVYVSLDGQQEGFIDRENLATKNGELTVNVGTKIYAKVAEIQGRNGAVRLAPIAIRGDEQTPEQGVSGAGEGSNEPTFATGMTVKGTVSRIERYGVFLNLAGSKKRGLLPAAESATPRGADLHKLFPMGSEVETKIIGIDEQGKIRLSIAALARDAEQKEFASYAQGGAPAAAPGGKNAKAEKPAPRSFGTFGDLLAKSNVKVTPKK